MLEFFRRHKKISISFCISAFLVLVGNIIVPLMLYLFLNVTSFDEVVGCIVVCFISGIFVSLPVNLQVFKSDLHKGIKIALGLFIVLMFALVMALPMLSFN